MFTVETSPRTPIAAAATEPRPWFDRSAAVWLLRAAAVGTVAYVVGWWSLGTTQVDFAVYLRGAHDIVHGHYLYAGATPTTQFTYPPFGAFLFVPFAVLPVHFAQLVWALVTLAMLAGLVRMTLDRLGEVGASSRWLPGVLLLLAPAISLEPVEHAFQLGQVDIFLAGLCLFDLGPTRLGRLPKGVLIGIAAAVKLTPFLFVPYLLLTRRSRQAVVATVSFGLLGLLGMAAGVHQMVHYWTRLVLNPHRIGHLWSISNQSLTGTMDRWIGHLPTGLGWDAVLAVAAAAGLALAVLTHRAAPLAADVIVGLTAVLVSPVSWTHHFVWLLPALLILASWGRHRRRWWLLGTVMAAVLSLELLYWVPDGAGWRLHPALWESVLACSYTVMALVVIVVLALGVRRVRAPALTAMVRHT